MRITADDALFASIYNEPHWTARKSPGVYATSHQLLRPALLLQARHTLARRHFRRRLAPVTPLLDLRLTRAPSPGRQGPQKAARAAGQSFRRADDGRFRPLPPRRAETGQRRRHDDAD